MGVGNQFPKWRMISTTHQAAVTSGPVITMMAMNVIIAGTSFLVRMEGQALMRTHRTHVL